MDLILKTILLVEDEAIVALMEKRWLENEGFRVIHCTSGENAVKQIQSGSEEVHLILMDIDLGPGIDGTEAAREILKTYDIPLLFVSSHTEPEIVEKTEEISSYGYVVKGSSKTVLLASIKMAFKLHKAKAELASLHDSSCDLARHADLQSLLKCILERSSSLLSMPRAAISLYDKSTNELELVAVHNSEAKPGIRLKLGEGAAGRVALTREPIMVDNYKNWEGRPSQLETEEQMDSCLMVPLNYGDVLLGVLGLYSSNENKRKFTESDKRIVLLFANQAAGAIHNLLLLQRKQKELEERKAVEQQLERNEYLLRLFIEHSPASIAMYDKNMITIAASHRYLQDYGITEDVTGRSHYEIFPEIPERWKEIHKRCLAGAVEKADMDSFVRADGKIDWVRWEIYPWYESTDVIGGIILFSEVITERKITEDKIENNIKTMKELNATKDKMFSILAHDLRGPFTGLVGISKELADNAANFTNEEISEAALVMNSSIQRIYGLLTNLLEWSRLQTGKIELKPGELNLYDEVASIFNLFSSAITKKSLRICNLIENDTSIYADPYSISTILRNLISNAIKFTPNGGTITISSVNSDGFITISVEDTGIGMSEDALDIIFRIDSGYTTDGTNGEEGSGLGLALCKDLVIKNGGELSVKSTPKIGSVFSFNLPNSIKN